MATLVIPANYEFLLSPLMLKGPCHASNIQIQVFLILHSVGDPLRHENILLYISGCKPHSMSRFYEVELGLKFTS